MRQTIPTVKNGLKFIFLIFCLSLMTNASHAADAIGVLLIVIVSVSIEREGLTLMEFQLSMDNFQDPQTNIAVVLTQTMPDEPV